jgi:acetolactate synthase I/II/III large subunit
VHRALQIARSEPTGPVYLVGPREVMEEQVEPCTADPAQYSPIAPGALSPEVTAEIATALARARRPLVVTGYLGRDTAAVAELAGLCDLLAIPVIESAPHHMNFPADHPMHSGYQWTTKDQNPVLAEADVILAIDSDVPWILVTSKPAPDAEIYCVDIDPLKSQMPM